MSRFLFNDASLHGQFHSLQELLSALGRVWHIKEAIQRSAFRLEINRLVANKKAVQSQTLRQAVNADANHDNKRRVLVWLDKDGPFWDDPPIHSSGEYFECAGEVVTETALAEGACLRFKEIAVAVVSLIPSKFSANPLEVFWRGRPEGDGSWNIPNFGETASIIPHLAALEKPPASWEQLIDWVTRDCSSLLLSPEIPSQLKPSPFSPAAARRAQELFKAMHEINVAIQKGETSRFNQLRSQWMEGGNARMTDSSETEKREFASELTFEHPTTKQFVACTWHAKIKTPQFRIHFEWPKPNISDPLFIAFFGPKITKR